MASPRKNPEVDAYIAEAEPFARPILKQLRKIVRKHCPRAEEVLKWSSPFFVYDGKILCGMAAFKKHCLFGFWNGALILNPDGSKAKVSMGYKRFAVVEDLPTEKQLAAYIKQAIKLASEETTPIKRAATAVKKPAPTAPPYLMRALRANEKALAHFQAFSPSAKRDYIDWIIGAKSEETRERRLETAVDWISEGKSRHWKYQSKK